MLTLEELYDQLKSNEYLMAMECQRNTHETKRLLELQYHRSIIKDCIIELLVAQIKSAEARKLKVV